MTENLAACLPEYGLTACGPLRPVLDGNVGRGAIAETVRGLVFVKQCSTRFDDIRLNQAAAAHEHAAAAGHAPRLIRTLDGARIACLAWARFTVTEFATPLAHPCPPQFASALAALHLRLDEFHPPQPVADDFLELPDPPAAGLRRLRDRHAQSANWAHIDRRLHILRTAGLASSDIAGLARPWVHGDAHPGNLLAAADQDRLMFTDFDQVSRFPRSYELLRAFFACLSSTPDPDAVARDLTAFTRAYEAVAPLPADERAVMIELFLTVQAAETRTFTSSTQEVRDMGAYAEARHTRLAWLAENHGVLRQALAGKEKQ